MSLLDWLDECKDDIELHHTFTISWSENGRGFGEYTFYTKDNQIHISNECGDKDTIKRILCKMVDAAILDDVR